MRREQGEPGGSTLHGHARTQGAQLLRLHRSPVKGGPSHRRKSLDLRIERSLHARRHHRKVRRSQSGGTSTPTESGPTGSPV